MKVAERGMNHEWFRWGILSDVGSWFQRWGEACLAFSLLRSLVTWQFASHWLHTDLCPALYIPMFKLPRGTYLLRAIIITIIILLSTGSHGSRYVCWRPSYLHHISNICSMRSWSWSQSCSHQQDKQILSALQHIFTPVAIGTAGTSGTSGSWAGPCGLGRRATIITERPLTCSSSYQWLFERGTNAVLF